MLNYFITSKCLAFKVLLDISTKVLSAKCTLSIKNVLQPCVHVVYVSVDSLVMSPMQIKEAPPALRCTVQHRENTDECGELAGSRWAPLLHHQVRDVSRLPRQLDPVLGPPVARGEERAAAFKSGAVESHGHHHQQARHDRQGVSRTVGQQQPPVQLHLRSLTKLKQRRYSRCKNVSRYISTSPLMSHITVHRGGGYLKKLGRGPTRCSAFQPLHNEKTQRYHSAAKSRNQEARRSYAVKRFNVSSSYIA